VPNDTKRERERERETERERISKQNKKKPMAGNTQQLAYLQ
jgi:hypothetical protein